MQRNEFLSLVLGAGAGLLGCASGSAMNASSETRTPEPSQGSVRPPPSPPSDVRRPIRAICFDLFTLFDPRSVVAVAQTIVKERAAELCESWRTRQFQYSWLRVSGDQYRDFHEVTHEALSYAARAHQLTLSNSERETLVGAYSKLAPWPDTHAMLQRFRDDGLRLAPLANYSPRMIADLLDHSRLTSFFDAQISTDAARTFKPDPRAYALGVSTLGLERDEIAFSAFGGWDAAGARWFGFPTFWVNRLGVPEEELAPGADGTGPTLAELAAFVSAWA